MIKLAQLFPIILWSIVGAVISSPVLIRLGIQLGLVDIPGAEPHKLHTTPTPMVGGGIIAAAIALGYIVVRPGVDASVIGIFVGGVVVLIWGMWDDRFQLPPLAKIAGQFLAALILWHYGVRAHLAINEWINFILTTLWIIGLINAFNFVDSMDGLALGLAGIAAAFFMLVTIDSEQVTLAYLCAALFGAAIGAYGVNAFPSKMFLGDSGSQLLGLFLAAIGIIYNPIGLDQAVSWFTPILVLGVPIFDMVLVVFSRIRHRRKIYQANRDHVYHRLLFLGLDSTRSVLAMQLMAIVLGLVAFIALDATPITANVIFAAVVLGGVISAAYLDRHDPTA
jgi:UDP-GlcNAc:undecaprenyl-phosphate GlcNAc-1-phosphate transferase